MSNNVSYVMFTSALPYISDITSERTVIIVKYKSLLQLGAPWNDNKMAQNDLFSMRQVTLRID